MLKETMNYESNRSKIHHTSEHLIQDLSLKPPDRRENKIWRHLFSVLWIGLLSQSDCWKFESQFKLGLVPVSLHISAVTDSHSTSSTNRQHHVKHVWFRTPSNHSSNQEEGMIDEKADRSWTERGREGERGRQRNREGETVEERERETGREREEKINSNFHTKKMIFFLKMMA